MIEVKAARIPPGRYVTLAQAGDGLQSDWNTGMQVLLCDRYSRVAVPAGVVGLWCPLSAGIWIEALGSRTFVKKGNGYTSDAEYAHEVSMPMHGASIAILARHAVWAKFMAMYSGEISQLPAVFPASQSMPVSMRLALLRLTRSALRSGDTLERLMGDRFGQVMLQMQQHFSPFIQRCPGSSAARKRQIFSRLQRVRHLIQTSPAKDVDISTLAILANYSPNQLIKLFNRVFGETPYFSLVRTRIEFARRLISETNMDISEISRASGFENRTSFARAFKIHSGSTASSFRYAARRA
ncbi:AraC family transcriptional regulator [Pseudolysobacter antarcticus]|uniref:AraC family transcriptional regulator n=1 Tax=Pseudolysobacter antarcticus TaxID=2511995 RepID=A0A411HHX7_9GAMM|nr:AraC family transcriptional regulator [Pseudolysobacter antarcticus]QBB70115.1 AraC family transcriptional regulator [Pseudolysobacter antarcticus]